MRHFECGGNKLGTVLLWNLICNHFAGEGKTLVGLLIALSYINNGEGPVVYVCPNIYLMQQACLDAQKFGIPFCIINKDNEIPNDFLDGKRVLITYVQKVFNGLSIFGTGNQSIFFINTIQKASKVSTFDAFWLQKFRK